MVRWHIKLVQCLDNEPTRNSLPGYPSEIRLSKEQSTSPSPPDEARFTRRKFPIILETFDIVLATFSKRHWEQRAIA